MCKNVKTNSNNEEKEKEKKTNKQTLLGRLTELESLAVEWSSAEGETGEAFPSSSSKTRISIELELLSNKENGHKTTLKQANKQTNKQTNNEPIA